MGFRQSYRCEQCGLEAVVSAGKDCGFYTETETRYCPLCGKLDDVGVSLWCKDSLPGLLPPGRIAELLEAEMSFGLCPTCKSPGGKPWRAGEPCPRCGGTVQPVDGVLEQWI
jgi:hypothetical protein